MARASYWVFFPLILVSAATVSLGIAIARAGAFSETTKLVLLGLALCAGFLLTLRFTKTMMLVCLLTAAAVDTTIGFAGVKGIYPYEALLVALLVVLCLRQVVGRWIPSAGPAIRLGPVERSMLLFSGWVILGYLVNIGSLSGGLEFVASLGFSTAMLETKLYINGLLTLAVCIGAFVLGKNLFDDAADFSRVCWTMLLAIAFPSLLTGIAWAQQTGGDIGRYNFVVPNDLGYGEQAAVSLLGLMIVLALLTNVTDRSERAALWACLFITAIPVVIIQSRSAYFYAIVEILLLVVMLSRSRRSQVSRTARTAVAGLVALGFVAVMVSLVGTTDIGVSASELLSTTSDTMTNKIGLIDAAWSAFLTQPLFGVGWGFYVLYSRIPVIVTEQLIFVATPHNGVMQLLAETGIGGLMIAMSASVFLLVETWRAFRALSSPLYRSLAAVVLVIVFIALVNQAIQGSLFFPPAAQRNSIRLPFYAWFLAGYVQGLRRIDGRSLRTQNEGAR